MHAFLMLAAVSPIMIILIWIIGVPPNDRKIPRVSSTENSVVVLWESAQCVGQ